MTPQEIVNYLQNLIQKIQNGSISLSEFQTISLILISSRHPEIESTPEHDLARYISTGWLIDLLNRSSVSAEPEIVSNMEDLD